MITIQAIINANIRKVWDYYTEPQHIVNWNFASEDWFCPRAMNDMIVGGKYLARMEAKDGSYGFDFEAVYNSIEPLSSFTYIMTDDRVVKVKFEKQTEEITLINVSFEPETENSLELQQQGWQAILNNFKKYTENN